MNCPRKTVFAFFAACLVVTMVCSAENVAPPKPLPPLPTRSQLAWEDGGLAMYLDFGMGTFVGAEQGNGKDDPKLFNPVKLDARQWVKLAKECGFKRIVLSVKNHDGFCLWPTATTKYSVAASDWKNGRGDVVKEFTDACHEAGIETGFYLSNQDKNNPAFGTAEYNKIYISQLRELLSNYGPVSELRFDGAGGEGTGAVGAIGFELKDPKQNYDWTNYYATVRRLQPQTIMVSVVGPDARWNGNNIGHTGEAWSPFDPASLPGPELTDKKQLGILNQGDPDGKIWLPVECFVRLRPHWSWLVEEDTNLITSDKLFNSWCKSYGHGCVLLLNVALNRDGLIPDAEVQRLRELHSETDKMFANDLVAGKPATASNVRGDDPVFGADKALDYDAKTYWATDDGVTNDCWLEVNLGKPVKFDTSVLRESIALGQRVAAYRIEVWQDAQWKLVVHGTTIGHLKLERFSPVTTDKVRLVIEKARACPLISQFSLYLRQM
jgi:alpha-L-fucosidase